jgi:Rho GDP-dissociation inhibitor
MSVDSTEAMLGSYGPQEAPYTKIVSLITPGADIQFASEESPSGMLARSGSYVVKSRIIDDDKKVWLDFEWGESHRARRG